MIDKVKRIKKGKEIEYTLYLDNKDKIKETFKIGKITTMMDIFLYQIQTESEQLKKIYEELNKSADIIQSSLKEKQDKSQVSKIYIN